MLLFTHIQFIIEYWLIISSICFCLCVYVFLVFPCQITCYFFYYLFLLCHVCTCSNNRLFFYYFFFGVLIFYPLIQLLTPKSTPNPYLRSSKSRQIGYKTTKKNEFVYFSSFFRLQKSVILVVILVSLSDDKLCLLLRFQLIL